MIYSALFEEDILGSPRLGEEPVSSGEVDGRTALALTRSKTRVSRVYPPHGMFDGVYRWHNPPPAVHRLCFHLAQSHRERD